MEMKKVALFGGSFNPPTLGHEFVANLALHQGMDEVWLMPCYKSLYGKSLAPDDQRLFMLRFLTTNNPKFKVSSWEINNKIEGRTFDIMNRLCEEHPENDFYFVIGGDNADRVPTEWYRGDELIKKHKFIVISRGGHDNEANWFTEEPHIYVDHELKMDVSSTEVRKLIKEGNFGKAGRKLAFGTLPYIMSYNIYKGVQYD